MSESGMDSLEIEIDPHALEFLKKSGDVFVLTDVQNPQYTYYRVKGYDANLKIKFEEFVEFCKGYPEDQNDPNNPSAEFVVTVFNVNSPSNTMPSNLGFYVTKSGFPTVSEWLKTLNQDEIPDCESGQRKTFYLYHIQTS
ncbi:MAG TPA: hypothetical protein VJY36_04575 [Candidatus Bathyarchaeia archaeon]|jgi:hypothetical protein|nr:hypothetical protein [Candidatus Bathyarchaeia archaeon]